MAHILVNKGILVNCFFEIVILFGSGEFSKNKKIGYFEELGFSSQLFDIIAAIAQDASFAVEEGNGTLARTRVFVTRIQGYQTSEGTQFFDINRFFVFGD